MNNLSIRPALYPAQSEPAQARAGRESGVNSERPAVRIASAVKAPEQAEQIKKVVDELKKIDRAVRSHEQAHLAAAGGLALGGPTFTLQYGPDGQAYAVAGEVRIDTSPGRTPEETISKAKQIRAAALAPTDPSSQDRAVAAAASQLEAQAQQELAQQARQAPTASATSSTEEESRSAESASTQSNKVREAIDSYEETASSVELGALINLSA